MSKIEYLKGYFPKQEIEYFYKTLYIRNAITMEEYKRLKKMIKIINIKVNNIVIGHPNTVWF